MPDAPLRCDGRLPRGAHAEATEGETAATASTATNATKALGRSILSLLFVAGPATAHRSSAQTTKYSVEP